MTAAIWRVYPFCFGVGGALTKLMVNCTNAGGAGAKLRVCIYTNIATRLYPDALFWDSGDIDVSGTGLKTISSSLPTFSPNTLYWCATNHSAGGFYYFNFGSLFPIGMDTSFNYIFALSLAAAYAAPSDPFPAGASKILYGGNNPIITLVEF
jgi:hypothetical protein